MYADFRQRNSLLFGIRMCVGASGVFIPATAIHAKDCLDIAFRTAHRAFLLNPVGSIIAIVHTFVLVLHNDLASPLVVGRVLF